MFTEALFTMAERQKRHIRPSINKQMSKMQYSYTMEYYLAVEGDEVLIHNTAWVNLGNATLNDRRQSWKATCCMIPFMRTVQDKSTGTERILMVV